VPQWRIARCHSDRCGVAFADPQPDDAWLAACYAQDYEKAGETSGHGSTAPALAHSMIAGLERRIGPLDGRRVLDFGAGIGTLAAELVSHGAVVHAVETSPTGQALIAAAGIPVAPSIQALSATGHGPPYDVVVAVEVIEHVRDPRATLRELHATMTPGGALFLTTPNLGSLRARVEGPRWPNVASTTHLYYFTAASLRRTLLAAGFEHVETMVTSQARPGRSPVRRVAQRGLQVVGLGGGLQVVAR
jgi:2-polyprenyl-3-methyl-5-hydroxy-6-metoxy-1,4-benzoquinol methylase